MANKRNDDNYIPEQKILGLDRREMDAQDTYEVMIHGEAPYVSSLRYMTPENQ